MSQAQESPLRTEEDKGEIMTLSASPSKLDGRLAGFDLRGRLPNWGRFPCVPHRGLGVGSD